MGLPVGACALYDNVCAASRLRTLRPCCHPRGMCGAWREGWAPLAAVLGTNALPSHFASVTHSSTDPLNLCSPAVARMQVYSSSNSTHYCSDVTDGKPSICMVRRPAPPPPRPAYAASDQRFSKGCRGPCAADSIETRPFALISSPVSYVRVSCPACCTLPIACSARYACTPLWSYTSVRTCASVWLCARARAGSFFRLTVHPVKAAVAASFLLCTSQL